MHCIQSSYITNQPEIQLACQKWTHNPNSWPVKTKGSYCYQMFLTLQQQHQLSYSSTTINTCISMSMRTFLCRERERGEGMVLHCYQKGTWQWAGKALQQRHGGLWEWSCLQYRKASQACRSDGRGRWLKTWYHSLLWSPTPTPSQKTPSLMLPRHLHFVPSLAALQSPRFHNHSWPLNLMTTTMPPLACLYHYLHTYREREREGFSFFLGLAKQAKQIIFSHFSSIYAISPFPSNLTLRIVCICAKL